MQRAPNPASTNGRTVQSTRRARCSITARPKAIIGVIQTVKRAPGLAGQGHLLSNRTHERKRHHHDHETSGDAAAASPSRRVASPTAATTMLTTVNHAGPPETRP